MPTTYFSKCIICKKVTESPPLGLPPKYCNKCKPIKFKEKVKNKKVKNKKVKK